MQSLEIPFTKNDKDDYIKRFHISKNVSFNIKKNHKYQNLVMIYENQFKIRISSFGTKESQKHQPKQYQMDLEQANLQNQTIQSKTIFIEAQKQYRDLYFQSVPYDALVVSSKSSQENNLQFNLIASSRSMPVRIYEVKKDTFTQKNQRFLNYCTFKDNKPNSQSFLSPYQFAIQNQKVIGVGKKFCSLYDCQKIKTSRIKAFDKIHLSTVQLLSDQTTALIGDFIGNIYFIDLREENNKLSGNHLKPHLDAIFHVKPFQQNQNLFLSSARKDNFTYLFDRRNLSTFVSFLEFQRNSNQRYGLSVSGDKFGIGTQSGQIYVNELDQLQNKQLKMTDQQNNLFEDRQKINITDLTLLTGQNGKKQVIYSLGTRFYEGSEQEQEILLNSKSKNFGLKKFNLHN